MARFGLWVAALSLVCLVAVVPSNDAEQMNAEDDICGPFLNEGPTMTISRVFDMVTIRLRDYVPDFGIIMLQNFMQYADSDHDDRLSRSECENLVEYIKNRIPDQGRK